MSAFSFASPLLLILALVAAQPAQAQEDAREAFEAGVASMEAEHFEEALAQFRRAEELHSHGVNQFNIGYCLEELQDLLGAIESYRLALESGQLPEAKDADARLRVERLEARLATLIITGAPLDVQVGDQVCTSPCRLMLNPGAHHVQWDGGSRDVRIPDGASAEVAVGVINENNTRSEAEAESLDTDEESAPDSPIRPRGTGWLISGGALAALGIAGSVGYGLHTETLKDRFDAAVGDEQVQLQDDGLRARRLTNAAIGIAAAGAVLVLVGVILKLRRGGERAEAPQLHVQF